MTVVHKVYSRGWPVWTNCGVFRGNFRLPKIPGKNTWRGVTCKRCLKTKERK